MNLTKVFSSITPCDLVRVGLLATTAVGGVYLNEKIPGTFLMKVLIGSIFLGIEEMAFDICRRKVVKKASLFVKQEANLHSPPKMTTSPKSSFLEPNVLAQYLSDHYDGQLQLSKILGCLEILSQHEQLNCHLKKTKIRLETIVRDSFSTQEVTSRHSLTQPQKQKQIRDAYAFFNRQFVGAT